MTLMLKAAKGPEAVMTIGPTQKLRFSPFRKLNLHTSPSLRALQFAHQMLLLVPFHHPAPLPLLPSELTLGQPATRLGACLGSCCICAGASSLGITILFRMFDVTRMQRPRHAAA